MFKLACHILTSVFDVLFMMLVKHFIALPAAQNAPSPLRMWHPHSRSGHLGFCPSLRLQEQTICGTLFRKKTEKSEKSEKSVLEEAKKTKERRIQNLNNTKKKTLLNLFSNHCVGFPVLSAQRLGRLVCLWQNTPWWATFGGFLK